MAQTAIELARSDIYDIARPAFAQALGDKPLNFEAEAGFAMQLLASNDYLLKTAMDDRQSLVDAVVNVAAIGISLNPAKKQAYLVPRRVGSARKVCLDISYMGLLDLVVQSGAIRWGQARLVHEKDLFEMVGVDKEPVHQFKPFGDRGAVVGGYCVVKTPDGDYLTDAMDVVEINNIRDRSESWKSGKSCPWRTDWGEMAKKTVIKRAYKTWPKTGNMERVEAAIQLLNETNGEGLAKPNAPAGPDITDTLAQVEKATSSPAVKAIWESVSKLLPATSDERAQVKAAVIARLGVIKTQTETIEPKEEAHAA